MGYYSLRSNGTWLSTIAPWGGLQVTWTWGNGGGGLAEATWEMTVPFDFHHPDLTRGSLVEVVDGSQPVARAVLSEPGQTDSGLAFTAVGVQRETEHFLALDGAGNSTSKSSTAVAAAIGRGLRVSLPAALVDGALVTGDAVQGVNYLDTQLQTLVDEFGYQWYVDGFGALRTTTDVTTPMWQVVPGTVNLAINDDTYASTLVGRYIDTGGVYQTLVVTDAAAEAMWGHREFAVDMTPYGKISLARVTQRLNGLLAKGRSQLTFTDRVTVTANQFTTIDGAPADLSLARGGQMTRFPVTGALAAYAGRNFVDLVMGEVVDPQNGESITISALDKGATSLADTFALTPPDRSFKA